MNAVLYLRLSVCRNIKNRVSNLSEWWNKNSYDKRALRVDTVSLASEVALRKAMSVSRSCLLLSSRLPDWNISTTIGWIAVTFCTDIHCSQTMNPTDSGDSLFLQCNHEVSICGFEWNVSTNIGWIHRKLGTDIHVPLRRIIMTLVIP